MIMGLVPLVCLIGEDSLLHGGGTQLVWSGHKFCLRRACERSKVLRVNMEHGTSTANHWARLLCGFPFLVSLKGN